LGIILTNWWIDRFRYVYSSMQSPILTIEYNSLKNVYPNHPHLNKEYKCQPADRHWEDPLPPSRLTAPQGVFQHRALSPERCRGHGGGPARPFLVFSLICTDFHIIMAGIKTSSKGELTHETINRKIPPPSLNSPSFYYLRYWQSLRGLRTIRALFPMDYQDPVPAQEKERKTLVRDCLI